MTTIALLVALKWITLRPEIISAKSFAEMISGKSLGTVTVAKELQKCHLYIDSRGASDMTVLESVASALNGSLVKTADGIQIQRTQSDIKRIQTSLALERAKWIRNRMNAIATFRSSHLASQDRKGALRTALSDALQEWQSFAQGKLTKLSTLRINQLLPGEKLLEGLINRIGIDEIASTPAGVTRVYEDHPMVDALPLPRTEDLRQAYEKEISSFQGFTIPENFKRILPIMGLGDVMELTSPPSPTKFRLAVNSSISSIEIQLQGFNLSGHQVSHAWLLAGGIDQPLSVKSIKADAEKLKVKNEIKLTTSAINALNFLSAEAPVPPLPKWYLHPDIEEPLNLFVRDVAEDDSLTQPSKCYVADISDDLFSAVRFATKDGKVWKEVLDRILKQSDPYEHVESNSAVVWRPKDPIFDEPKIADRKVLANFAQREKLGLTCNIRTLALLSHDLCEGFAPFYGVWTSRVEAGGALQSGQGNFSGSAMKLLGSLNDDLWTKFMQGTPISALSLNAVAELQRVLKDDWYLSVVADFPVPELYEHPFELYDQQAIDVTQISFSTIDSEVFRLTMDGGAHVIDCTAKVFKGAFAVDLMQYVEWSGDQPTFKFAREDYESRFGQVRFRHGVRTNKLMTIYTPQQTFIKFEAPNSLKFEEQELGFADLSQQERDELWQTTVDNSIKNAVAIRQSSKVNTRQPVAVGPGIPPP